MKTWAASLLLIATIPLLAFAIEPADPTTLCTRFVSETDIKNCEAKLAKEEADWYAASVCGQQEKDEAFWQCWEQIKGKPFQLQTLQTCSGENPTALSDDERLACLKKSQLSSRVPASEGSGLFQPLKVKKKK